MLSEASSICDGDERSARAAQPFKDVAARMEAWFANAQVLFASELETPGFRRDLVDLAERAEQLYSLYCALPDPLNELMDECGAKSFADGQPIIAGLLAVKGFSALDFREVEIDPSALGLDNSIPANV